ncbi:MAG: helix-turn-helix domain-containing protein [Rhizobiales bacterium]|nr:helix-turn-helix domain-containing protein [Hyphomicrobiales bacterium]
MTTDNRTKTFEGSQTLARGLNLLDVIASGQEGVPVRDLAAGIGLPRSIVQRLLYTLEAEGYLERHPSQVGYRLAIKLWRLGCQSIRGVSVRDVARPHLEALARRTNEMVKLAILNGRDVVYIDGIDSSQSIRAYVPIGGSAPAHSSATGKAILAFLPAETLASAGPSMRRYTSHTVIGDDAFAKELQRIRQRGYAINRGEWEAEIGGVAAPVFDADNRVVASIGVIMPLNRCPAGKATQLGGWISAAAADISRQLGHRAGDAKVKRAG